MYLTQNNSPDGQNFCWDKYFKYRNVNQITTSEAVGIVNELREFLSEDPLSITFCLTKLLKQIMKNIHFDHKIKILELGAATGFLTRSLLMQYEGSASLVDQNEQSYLSYIEAVSGYADELNVRYIINDIFSLEQNPEYDIVCSFGLVEHFKEKKTVLDIHKAFLAERGYALILVPADTLLSRAYWGIHPELNLGYRELLTLDEFKEILIRHEFNITAIAQSCGYVYDFIAALCKTKK